MEIIRKMENRIIEEYEKYKKELFKVGHIKEDSFTSQSFIQYLKNKKKPKTLIENGVWYKIEMKYNGIWIK